MTAYDPNNWLVTMPRVIGEYVGAQLAADPGIGTDAKVEMSFPDTHSWVKTTPLDKIIIHFEEDHIEDPVLGFGIPGVDVIDDTDPANPTIKRHEAAHHLVNYDVGVWVSAELGGVTKRTLVKQVLKNIFTTATGKIAFNEATGGLQVVSFVGGRDALDRINDVPVWRALDMTLIVSVFSRHIPTVAAKVPVAFVQAENLTIPNPDGSSSPVTTP